MNDIKLKATAKVKLIKKDDKGAIIEVKEHEIALTEKEARDVWLSQQQA